MPGIRLAIGTATARDESLEAAHQRADAEMIEAKRRAPGVSSARKSA
jgi:hypothetical protein